MDWYWWLPDQLTAEEYACLPDEFRRTIELIDGHIVKCESADLLHDRVSRHLAAALEAGRPPGSRLVVELDVDVWICPSPPSLRRPDVTVHRSGLNGTLHAEDVVLVVEVVSPGSSDCTDTIVKKAEYAAAGILVYLLVSPLESGDGIARIEEFRLAGDRYHLVALHTRQLTMDEPIPIDAAFSALM